MHNSFKTDKIVYINIKVSHMKSLSSAINYKKILNFGLKSIKERMIIYFSVLIILSITIFGLLDFYNFSNTYLTDNINFTSTIANQVTINLDTYLQEAETSLKVLAVNDLVVSSIKNYPANTAYENLQNHNSLNKMANDIIAQKPDINNIVIYSNGIVFGSNYDLGKITNMSFLKSLENEYRNSTIADVRFFKNYVARQPSDNDINTRISVSLPIRDLEKFSRVNLGYAAFDFNMNRIEKMFQNSALNKNSVVLITDFSSNIIYSNNESFFRNNFNWNLISDVYKNPLGTFTRKIDKNNMLVTYSTSRINNWKVVFIISMSELDKNLSKTRFFTILLILVSVIITVLISMFISVKSTRPLINLVKQMRLVGQGNLDIRIYETGKGYEEISTLNNGFNSMMDRINQLIKEVYQTRLKQHEAEFEALQAKINPHFLYNTLQTINSLAVLERTKEIEQVTTSLGNLLEYLVYEQNEMVKVYKEIDYIKSYLEIQNFRYNNSFKVSIDIEQDVYSCYILKLLLQPLVENAILHGLDKKRENGILHICGKLENGSAAFEVTDNGIGMNSETLKDIRKKLELSVSGSTKKSIGLMNVHERIKLKFGENYGIEINSALNEGTKVKVIIPVINIQNGEISDD